MTHVPEIVAENQYQKPVSISNAKRYVSTALTFYTPHR